MVLIAVISGFEFKSLKITKYYSECVNQDNTPAGVDIFIRRVGRSSPFSNKRNGSVQRVLTLLFRMFLLFQSERPTAVVNKWLTTVTSMVGHLGSVDQFMMNKDSVNEKWNAFINDFSNKLFILELYIQSRTKVFFSIICSF